jgi:hypothetical protein
MNAVRNVQIPYNAMNILINKKIMASQEGLNSIKLVT